MWAELLWFVCGNFQIFATMATGVGLAQISLTQLNRQTPKTPYLAQESWWYLIHKLIKSTHFCNHGNKGGSSENLNDFIWSSNPKTPSLVQHSGTYLKCELSYSKFCVEISKFSFPRQQGNSLTQISLITACAVATSCCISDEPCQWEKANFDP